MMIMQIGEYQLQNLIKTRTPFHFFDLCDQRCDHALTAQAQHLQAASVLKAVSSLQKNAPIVLICETGAKSMVVAEELAQNSFINVFVIEGGIAGLKASSLGARL